MCRHDCLIQITQREGDCAQRPGGGGMAGRRSHGSRLAEIPTELLCILRLPTTTIAVFPFALAAHDPAPYLRTSKTTRLLERKRWSSHSELEAISPSLASELQPRCIGGCWGSMAISSASFRFAHDFVVCSMKPSNVSRVCYVVPAGISLLF